MRGARLLALLLPIWPGSLITQQIAAQQTAPRASASLAGVLTHINGARMPEATAELHSEKAPANTFRTVTDSLGIYDFSSLPPGDYELQLSRPGFSRLTIRSIQITAGQPRELPTLQLNPAFCGDGQALLDYARLLRPGDVTGNLTGRVVLDQRPLLNASPPVPAAEITLLCGAGQVCGTAATDEEGQFAFWDLPPGTFSVRVNHAGYYPVTRPGFLIREGLDSVFQSIYMERCPAGNCEPAQRPKRQLSLCESR